LASKSQRSEIEAWMRCREVVSLMYVLPAFTSSITPKTPLAMNFNRKYFFFKQGLSISTTDLKKSLLFDKK
jgi:hypothetical protein